MFPYIVHKTGLLKAGFVAQKHSLSTTFSNIEHLTARNEYE